MSVGSDLGFEPATLNENVLSEGLDQVSVSERFVLRVVELAKQGTLGSLRTRKASLQRSYGLLASLISKPWVPILFYGEPGSGKRRLVDEFLTVSNFYSRLEGREFGKLRVLNGAFCRPGFTEQLSSGQVRADDLCYIEAVDLLDASCQQELMTLLKARDQHGARTPLPRIIVGTERALSLMVLQNQFSRELFQCLTSFALFLPSLNERPEDMLHLLETIAEKLTKKSQRPPTWLVDLLASQLWGDNLDELEKLLASGLRRNPELARWTYADLPEYLKPSGLKGRFSPASPNDVSRQQGERLNLKRVLIAAGGDRELAAQDMGIAKSDLLKKMFALGLR